MKRAAQKITRKILKSKPRPLWKCPKCGERFVTAHMWHSCGKQSLAALFVKCEPQVFRCFRKFARMVRACGPVRMIPQKTRIVFQVRVRYAGVYPRKSHLVCGFALPRRVNDSRFFKITPYAPHFIGHLFRVQSEKDLDGKVQRWLREAYGVGEQRYLKQGVRGRR